MEIHTIKTEKDYEETLKLIDELLITSEIPENTEKLEILSILVEDYENKHYREDELEKTIKELQKKIEVLEKKVEMAELYILCQRDAYPHWNLPIHRIVSEYYKDIAERRRL